MAFGSVIGRRTVFEVDGARHGLNLFAVIVGVSGKGRKGTSWAQTLHVFQEVDPEWVKDHIASGLSSGEGLIHAVRDPIIEQQPAKRNGNPTGEYKEVIVDHGVADKRLLVVESEFASVLRVMGRDGSTLSPTLRAAWDSGDLRTLTKNSPARATDAHISIIAHITGEELKRYLSATESGNGFGNRFLWVCARRSKLLPDGGSPVALSHFSTQMQHAAQFAQQEQIMARDEEARSLWHEVYAELSEGYPGLFGALTGRAEAQTMRMAAIYALLDSSPVIQVVHLRAALAVWKYCEDSVRFLFGDSMGDPIADEILAALQRALPDGMTQTDISNTVFQRNQKAERINAAFFRLLQQRRVRSEPRETNGRSAEVWFAVAERN